MIPNETLTTDQQRQLYVLCWEFEDSWTRGERRPPHQWLSQATDLPPEIVLAELIETQRELEQAPHVPRVATPTIHDARYEFIEEIARGGAAVVWRVRDRHLQRETAVKYLLDSRDNREMRLRLEREARLCARLVHPGIVPIHELSSFADQRPFVSMKLVEGKTLLQLLESNPPTTQSTLLDIFVKVCQAMAYAHGKGIIHRDLKPSNIMVGAFGEVQIMDWGLAKDLTVNPSVDLATNQPAIQDTVATECRNMSTTGDIQSTTLQNDTTIFGSVFGTIAYMAPEQARGEVDLVDKRSDVFALGAILCRLLTGSGPYGDVKQDEMLVKAKRAELQPSLQRLGKSRHRRLATLAMICMSVDREVRPQDAAAIVEHLSEIKNGERRRTKLAWCTAMVSLVATTAAYSWITGVTRSSDQALIAPLEARTAPAKVLSSTDAKNLLRLKQDKSVLQTYREILENNPTDKELFQSITIALVNSERFREAEKVAHELVQLEPGNPDYHFLLSDTLFYQGKFELADIALHRSRDCRDAGIPTGLPIDLKIHRLQKFIDFSQQVTVPNPPKFDSLDASGLRDVGQVCDLIGRVDLAVDYYKRSLAKEDDIKLRSVLRYNFLTQFVRRNLERIDLTTEYRNQLNELVVEWVREQNEFLRNAVNEKSVTAQCRELLFVLKQCPTMDFARTLVKDNRAAPEVRVDLQQLFAEIQQLELVVP